MNIFLTSDLRETETLENALFVDIDDVESFIKYCDNHDVISEGVKIREYIIGKEFKVYGKKLKMKI